jgi:hypothetical protein
MMLFPFDDYKAWSGVYPPEVAQRQFAKLAALWNNGLITMERSLPLVSAHKLPNARLDFAIARTCYHHFQSTANQMGVATLRRRTKHTESVL